MNIGRRFFNAVPLAISAVSYGIVYFYQKPLWGLDSTWLTQIFMLEFLAIHCFPFATMIVLWNPAQTRQKGLRWFYFSLLLLFYLAGAYSIAGLAGCLGLGVLIVSTYFGFLLGLRKGVETRELIARGSVNFVVFLLCIAINDLPQHVERWKGTLDTVRTGLMYFSVLALIEVSGIYQRPWLHKLSKVAVVDVEPSPGPSPGVKEVLREAILPLVNSIGLAIAPYVFIPWVAAMVARIIDEKVTWSMTPIGYWYLTITVLPLWLIRSYQIKLAFGASLTRANKRIYRYLPYAGLLVLYASIGAYTYLDGGIEYGRWWTLEDIGIFLCPDFLLCLILVPATWATTGKGNMARQGHKTDVR